METNNTTKQRNKDVLFNIRLTAEDLQAWHDLTKRAGFATTSDMVRAGVETLTRMVNEVGEETLAAV